MHDGGKEWRLKAENIFKNISEAKDVTIKVINPTRYFDRDGGNAITNKQVKQFYLSSSHSAGFGRTHRRELYKS